MKKINKIFLTALFLMSFGFVACDSEEEQITFSPGDNLLISGSGEILTYEANTYNVEGFTIDETYTWSVSGDGTATVQQVAGRDGEFVSVSAEDAGTYTVSVSNDAGLEGSYTFAVETVNEFLGFAAEDTTLMLYENQYNAGADTLFLPVNISERNVFETTAEFTVVSGTAVEGTDYEVLNSTNVLTFDAGDTQDTVKILLYDNITVDSTRDFSVQLGDILTTGPKSAAVESAPDSLNIGQSTIFIQDDLKYFSLIVEDTLVELNSAGNYEIGVNLSAASEYDATLNYTVTDSLGNPFITPDPDLTEGMLEFFAGDTEGRIVIKIPDAWVAAGEEPTEINIELTSVMSTDGELLLGESSTSFTILAGPVPAE